MSLKPESADVFDDPNASSRQPRFLSQPRDVDRAGGPVNPAPGSRPFYGTEAGELQAPPPLPPIESSRPTIPPAAGSALTPLFDPSRAKEFQARWNEIQVAFVDEPHTAVERADNLVDEVTKHLTDSFAAGRRKLEAQWEKGGDASTENLRIALQQYRSFFNRLLAI